MRKMSIYVLKKLSFIDAIAVAVTSDSACWRMVSKVIFLLHSFCQCFEIRSYFADSKYYKKKRRQRSVRKS